MIWTRKLAALAFVTFLLSSCSLLSVTETDQATLDTLREAGSDLSKIHPFDFYLYHPEESEAVQICSQLRAEGFQVITREGALGDEWLCLASMSFVPSIEKLSELQDRFEHIINQYGGEYDGWETIVIQ